MHREHGDTKNEHSAGLQARLPFYDNTLDIVHTMHATKYLPLIEFEEMLFDWDRVLRPGGVAARGGRKMGSMRIWACHINVFNMALSQSPML